MKFLRKYLTDTNVLVVLLLIYGAFALIFEKAAHPDAEVVKLIGYIDFFIISIVAGYGIREFFRYKRKVDFLKKGWIFLIAAVPALPLLGDWVAYIRIVHYFLLIELFRGNKLIRRNKDGYNDEIVISIMMGIFVVLISCILILHFENVPEGNIKTTGEAIYWAIITIATVGYGDFYPVTAGGRMVAVVLLFSGVSLFISITGYFAAWMGKSRQQRDLMDDE